MTDTLVLVHLSMLCWSLLIFACHDFVERTMPHGISSASCCFHGLVLIQQSFEVSSGSTAVADLCLVFADWTGFVVN